MSSDWSVSRSVSSDWSVSGSRDLVRHFEWGDNSGFRALFGIFGRFLLFGYYVLVVMVSVVILDSDWSVGLQEPVAAIFNGR